MASATITYNGKTITLERPPSEEWKQDAYLDRTITKTLTGKIETIVAPRIDVRFYAKWRPLEGDPDGAGLRRQLDNWWQWAQQGNTFRVNMYPSQTGETVLASSVLANATSLTVVSTTGIGNRDYVLVGGPYFQIVTVSSVSGATVNLSTSLDFPFPAGSTFRERWMMDLKWIDPAGRCPIRDIEENSNRSLFDFYIDGLCTVDTPSGTPASPTLLASYGAFTLTGQNVTFAYSEQTFAGDEFSIVGTLDSVFSF